MPGNRLPSQPPGPSQLYFGHPRVNHHQTTGCCKCVVHSQSLEKRSWAACTMRDPFKKESSYVHAELDLPCAEILYNTQRGSCWKANASWQHGWAPSEGIPRVESLQHNFCSLCWSWKTRGFPCGVRKRCSQKQGQGEGVWENYKAKDRGKEQ